MQKLHTRVTPYMVFLREVYDKVVTAFSSAPVESGGILGEKDGIICAFYFDDKAVSNRGEYIPDVDGLNKIIKNWAENNINFAGLIHSHANGQALLSEQDKAYAKAIFETNPALKTLYFPVVIYNNGKPEIISYKFNGKWEDDKVTVI